MRFEWILPALSCGASALLTAALASRRYGVPIDRPNARSLHSVALPRGGGLAIWAGWALALPWLKPDPAWLLPALGLAAVSFLDDRGGLPVIVRLLAQLAACAAFVLLALNSQPPAWTAIDILGLAWMLNLFNFMDGSDGLAAGMAVSGFAALSIAWAAAGTLDWALLAASLASACLGFLLFNFHPARIFMGDVGSVPLGFLAGAFGMLGAWRGDWTLAFPLLVFLPFIADASLTLAHRLLRGERVWQAHREHYYQRLVQLGWSHRRTALAYYALMLATAGSALAALWLRPDAMGALLLAWCVVCGALSAAVDRRWARHQHRTAGHAH